MKYYSFLLNYSIIILQRERSSIRKFKEKNRKLKETNQVKRTEIFFFASHQMASGIL